MRLPRPDKSGLAMTSSVSLRGAERRSNLVVGLGLDLAGGFVPGAEASGADVDFSWPSLYHNRSPLDIRQPLSRGMLFGMAYTISEGSSFTANFALHRNFSFC
jgi:hypothetical protein